MMAAHPALYEKDVRVLRTAASLIDGQPAAPTALMIAEQIGMPAHSVRHSLRKLRDRGLVEFGHNRALCVLGLIYEPDTAVLK